MISTTQWNIQNCVIEFSRVVCVLCMLFGLGLFHRKGENSHMVLLQKRRGPACGLSEVGLSTATTYRTLPVVDRFIHPGKPDSRLA
jgi:hypothetical protein